MSEPGSQGGGSGRELATDGDPAELAAEEDLPPVVARLVVEIRSDGRRTIARGALEDRALGQTVAIEADAGSPWALARKLAGAVLSIPTLARRAAGDLLPLGRRRRRRRLPPR